MWKHIADRESGRTRPNYFASRLKSNRASSIDLSNHKEFVSPHKDSINCLQVDLAEGRYLLSGVANASVSVFDVQGAADHGEGLIAKHKSIFTIDKQHDSAYKYAVSSAIWYPVDIGLFITGSDDHFINVWDTNTTQAVMNFKMPGKVYKIAMSPLTNSHMLLAAGSEDVQVRLCNTFTHMLSRHRDSVMSIEWSLSSEWVLMTGGCDGAIRFWDTRRAESFQVLDKSQSQLGRRPPVLRRCASEKFRFWLPNYHKVVQLHLLDPGRSNEHKQSSNRNRSQTNGTRKQRIHRGLLSMQDRATAHYGAVTSLKVTEDGMYHLSAGSELRLRLWDIESSRNTLINYETSRLQGTKPMQIAVSQDSSQVVDLWSERTSKTFRGHYESVNCCCFNHHDQEQYAGGNDVQILVRSPRFTSDDLIGMKGGGGGRGQYPIQDQDNRSD